MSAFAKQREELERSLDRVSLLYLQTGDPVLKAGLRAVASMIRELTGTVAELEAAVAKQEKERAA